MKKPLFKEDFHAAVHVAAFFILVVVLEGLATAHRSHAAGGNTLLHQVILTRNGAVLRERKSTHLNSSPLQTRRMPDAA